MQGGIILKKYFKEAFAVFLIVIVTIVFSLNTNAETDTVKVTFADAYLTFEVWQGDGNTSISIGDDFLTKDCDIVKFEEFKEVQFKGEVFDDSNYFVTEEDNKTIITLKEEYVKTLPEGEHYFTADFMNVNVKLKLRIEILKTTVPIKKPKQVKNVKVISNKKKIIIKWKKQKYITGYQVKIGRNNKITKNKKVITINKNKNKIVFKDLKANKKYFVKVRAYKVINGKKYWGVWSKRVSKKNIVGSIFAK